MSTDSTASSVSSGTLPATSSTAALVYINPYATVCVRSHVPVTLELKNPNYAKWSSFFTSLCGKFGLLGHIDDYCKRMKSLADALGDVGYKVDGPQLVLNLLRGLDPCYFNTADDIANSKPLPSFAEAHNMLRLKELRLANDVKNAQATALAVAGTGSTPGTCAGGWV